MRVLLLTREFPPYIVGGVAYHSYNLARLFADSGHEVTVLTTTSGDHTDDGNFDLSGIDVVRFDCPTTASPRLWFDRIVRRVVSGEEAFESVDLVHSHEYVRFDRLDIDAPTILKVHFNIGRKFDFFSFESYHPIIQPLVRVALQYGIAPFERQLARHSLETADGRIFISRLVQENTAVDVMTRPTTVIHNGVDLDQFTPTASGDSIDQVTSEIDMNSDEDHFLFVGGTQQRKGYKTLVSAARDADWSLSIVGAEEPPGQMSSNVEFLGRIPQTHLPSLYRRATALVHPALYEPFGNVVLEALACGTPVVVSTADYCGVAELLDEAVCETVDPTDAHRLQTTLTAFDPSDYDPATCRAVATNNPWERVAEETITFAESLTTGIDT